MQTFIFALTLFFGFTLSAQASDTPDGTKPAGQIALTFDDAPRPDGKIYTGAERAQTLIRKLKDANVQAAFFVNTHSFTLPERRQRIEAYAKAGHLIANHTHSHPSLHKVPAQQFIEDIRKADKLLRSFAGFTKLFRYPFLHEGATTSTRDTVRTHLRQTGYRNAYVTVDNYDYYIDNLVQRRLASGKKVNLDKVCQMLTDIMWEGILYYDQVAKENLGSVRHVLLMHENDTQALCLDRLIAKIRSENWQLITPSQAYNDPILKRQPKTLYLNQGRIAALVNEKTGAKPVSKWESTKALDAEFQRRGVVE